MDKKDKIKMGAAIAFFLAIIAYIIVFMGRIAQGYYSHLPEIHRLLAEWSGLTTQEVTARYIGLAVLVAIFFGISVWTRNDR